MYFWGWYIHYTTHTLHTHTHVIVIVYASAYINILWCQGDMKTPHIAYICFIYNMCVYIEKCTIQFLYRTTTTQT